MLLGFGGLLALFQLGHDVLHHLRMGQQVFLDDGSDFLPLVGGETSAPVPAQAAVDGQECRGCDQEF